jgi:hypothetical protein
MFPSTSNEFLPFLFRWAFLKARRGLVALATNGVRCEQLT